MAWWYCYLLSASFSHDQSLYIMSEKSTTTE